MVARRKSPILLLLLLHLLATITTTILRPTFAAAAPAAAHSYPLHLHVHIPGNDTPHTFTGISSGVMEWDTKFVGAGEVVFSTAMTGYVQSITDKSFSGLIHTVNLW